ncbi:MAG TPA: hypothetical protein VL981_00930 [Candidatus Methylacidiphilales bacterium]|nr:hypothetical protein [Candidatus Methylacidiphilales bacterium]
MKLFVDTIGDIIGIVGIFVLIFYVPFAKTWQRAVFSVFFIALLWGIVRILASGFSGEADAPGIGFLVVPFFYALVAGLIRGITALLFKIPILAKYKEKMRGQR